MNERIRQLAKEAGITTNIETDYFERDMNKWVDYFSEKFAELIVRECIGIADEYDGVGSTIVGRIEKHFGVEE